MDSVSINNQELIDLLDEYTNLVIPRIDEIELRGETDENEYYTSDEYFETIDKDAHIGFPEECYGNDLIDRNISPFYDQVYDIRERLKRTLVSPTCAVMMYYPTGGYMGWHNNHNAPGYNILLSYTQNGNGFFRYKDPETGANVTMMDKPGWTAKVGYFGEKSEPDKLYWHCARAYEPRLTLGYVIPDETFWKMMIEDISDH